MQRLVAAAFIGKPIPKGLVVHHKDNNKINNKVTNLEVVTHAQNIQYAYDDKLFPARAKLSAFQQQKVIELYKSGGYFIRQLAAMFNVHKVTINKIVREAGCPMHYSSKLPPKIREEIRSRYVPRKVSMRQLALEYGVSEGTIESVIGKRSSGRRKPSTKPRKNNHIDDFFNPTPVPETTKETQERLLRELIMREYQIPLPAVEGAADV